MAALIFAEKGVEVAAAEGEQDIGAGQCGAEDRLVFRHIENKRPVKSQHVIVNDDFSSQSQLCIHRSARLIGEVFLYFAQHPGRYAQLPPL